MVKRKNKKKKKTCLDNMDIINFDHLIDEEARNPCTQNDWRMFQHPCNIILNGKTGCGKGNLLSNLIFRFLNFDKLYIYGKQINQDKYNHIRQTFAENDMSDKLVMSDDYDDVIDVRDLDPMEQSLVVIDDFVAEKDQKKFIDLFISGRHGNASTIYLTQSYTAVPRKIRINTHYIVLYKTGNRKELKLLYQDLGDDIEFSKFQAMYKEAVAEPYSFFLIDKKTAFDALKYRKRFDYCCFN